MPAPADWPGEVRRCPPRSFPTYSVAAPLSTWLQAEAAAATLRLPGGYRVLDVGCGVKPFYPFFAAGASTYVGVDVDNAAADLEGRAEHLPVPDGSYDLVLCTQVLEHTDDPSQVVRELRRVVAPGGRVLASTHGVQVYHPAPVDLWRWTHTGLERLFRQNGHWSWLSVSPSAGAMACVGMLVSIYVNAVARRAHVAPLGRAVVATINTAAAAVDRSIPALREPRPGTVFANYHVTAVA